MPGHPGLLCSIHWGFSKVLGSTREESSDPFVGVVSSIPAVVDISDVMGGSVPAPVANVEATHKSHALIYHNAFLVMTPLLGNNRMSSDSDIPAQRLQVYLCIIGVVAQKAKWLSEENDEDFDPSVPAVLEDPIQPI